MVEIFPSATKGMPVSNSVPTVRDPPTSFPKVLVSLTSSLKENSMLCSRLDRLMTVCWATHLGTVLTSLPRFRSKSSPTTSSWYRVAWKPHPSSVQPSPRCQSEGITMDLHGSGWWCTPRKERPVSLPERT